MGLAAMMCLVIEKCISTAPSSCSISSGLRIVR
jgi:hypothetical protein